MIVYMGYSGKLWVYSDTRVSTTSKDGLTYHIHDNYEKAKAYHNKIVVGMGHGAAVKYVFEQFDQSNQEIKDLEQITRDAYDFYDGEIGMYVFTSDRNGKFWVYTISNLLDFRTSKERIRDNDLGAAGANSGEALEYISKMFNKRTRPHDAILGAYKHVADEKVGGKCIVYQLDYGNYKCEINRYDYLIKDTKRLRQYKLNADMAGKAKLKKVQITDGINTALLDSESRKFYLNNWDIEGIGSLDAKFIQAGALTVDDGFINNLTVNALKTIDKSDSIGDSVDYVHIRDNYMKLTTGTITGREQAKDSNGNLLYWTDASKTMLTTETTAYPFYNLTYDPVDKFKLYLYGQGVDSYPVMELGRGDGATTNSAKAIIKKEPTNLNITYHKSNDGAVRQVVLGDLGITIKAESNGDITIEGRNINVKASGDVKFEGLKYDFA
ncbi:hypothetical protein [Paenibacillus sp. DYY-L-2]|uniref:hypothetical protein n=1 Tax=Paenibacillus sp. DYY-L-2 TaxID=3447013 RepID=UPI003F4FA1A5